MKVQTDLEAPYEAPHADSSHFWVSTVQVSVAVPHEDNCSVCMMYVFHAFQKCMEEGLEDNPSHLV